MSNIFFKNLWYLRMVRFERKANTAYISISAHLLGIPPLLEKSFPPEASKFLETVHLYLCSSWLVEGVLKVIPRHVCIWIGTLAGSFPHLAAASSWGLRSPSRVDWDAAAARANAESWTKMISLWGYRHLSAYPSEEGATRNLRVHTACS